MHIDWTGCTSSQILGIGECFIAHRTNTPADFVRITHFEAEMRDASVALTDVDGPAFMVVILEQFYPESAEFQQCPTYDSIRKPDHDTQSLLPALVRFAFQIHADDVSEESQGSIEILYTDSAMMGPYNQLFQTCIFSLVHID